MKNSLSNSKTEAKNVKSNISTDNGTSTITPIALLQNSPRSYPRYSLNEAKKSFDEEPNTVTSNSNECKVILKIIKFTI